MIRKMRRRYLIANMTLLSLILFTGLGILFGVLYHAEVAASYSVMETMMQRAPLPEQKRPPEEAEPQSQNAESGSFVPLSYGDYGSWGDYGGYQYGGWQYGQDQQIPAQSDTQEQQTPQQQQPNWGDWSWQVPQTPPYYPGGFDYNYNNPPFTYNPYDYWNPGSGSQDDGKQDSGKQDDGKKDEKKADDSGSGSKTPAQSTPYQYVYPFVSTAPQEGQQDKKSSSTRYTMPWERYWDNPYWKQSDAPQETEAPKETETQPSAAEQPVQTAPVTGAPKAAVTQNAEPAVSPAGTTRTTEALVPVEEGQYVPDAFVVQADEDGNIEAYAGNGEGSSDSEQFSRVHRAVHDVRRHRGNAGTVDVGESSYRYLYQPDSDGNYRLVLLDRTQEQTALKKLVFIFAFIALIGLACMFGLSLLLTNWTVTPAAEAWEKQKQFVADASHELKTPLAVISANTDVIRRNPAESVESQRKWLSLIQAETLRMSKLISNLLSAARMDSPAAAGKAATISLSRTVSSVCLLFEPVIYEKNKSLSTAIQRDVMISADEDNVRQLLSVLLDNAVVHSLPKARISVTLSKDAQGKIRLAVSNPAEDIPKDQLAHLFDRFYRVDKTGSPNGSGLGLSIAQSIVAEMGGKLTVTSENGLITFVAVF